MAITVKPAVLPTLSAARSAGSGGVHADVMGPPLGGNGQPAGYPAYEAGYGFPGDFFTDGPNLGESDDITGDCYLDSGSPLTSFAVARPITLVRAITRC